MFGCEQILDLFLFNVWTYEHGLRLTNPEMTEQVILISIVLINPYTSQNKKKVKVYQENNFGGKFFFKLCRIR